MRCLVINQRIRFARQRVYCLVNIADNDAPGNVHERVAMLKHRTIADGVSEELLNARTCRAVTTVGEPRRRLVAKMTRERECVPR